MSIFVFVYNVISSDSLLMLHIGVDIVSLEFQVLCSINKKVFVCTLIVVLYETIG